MEEPIAVRVLRKNVRRLHRLQIISTTVLSMEFGFFVADLWAHFWWESLMMLGCMAILIFTSVKAGRALHAGFTVAVSPEEMLVHLRNFREALNKEPGSKMVLEAIADLNEFEVVVMERIDASSGEAAK